MENKDASRIGIVVLLSAKACICNQSHEAINCCVKGITKISVYVLSDPACAQPKRKLDNTLLSVRSIVQKDKRKLELNKKKSKQSTLSEKSFEDMSC